jgi:hypothetical protein
MAMTEKDDDRMLTELFASGRRHAPVPSDAFMERLVADAEGALERPVAVQSGAVETIWMRLSEVFGGWQGFGGLATATVAGLWIGYAGLADPDALSGGLLGSDETVELLPDTDFFALATELEN